MKSNFENLSAEVLLRETAWLKGLSRQLVADSHRAEDVSQEAWLALAGQPRPIKHRRTWLVRVARNFAARFTLRESQREAREATAARPEAQPSAEESVQRVRIQNRIVTTLLQLSEPHRTTVVLRFFEDLPPREISSRMGVPVETVRSRLRVALARMRAHLDSEFSSRPAWAAPLASYFGAPRALETGLLVGSIMKAKMLTAATIVLMASGIGYLLLATGSPTTDTSQYGSPEPLAGTVGQSSQMTRSPGAVSLESHVPETSGGERTAISLLARNTVTLTGRCVDVTTRQPVSGVLVALEANAPLQVSARTAAVEIIAVEPQETARDGRFALTFATATDWTFTLELSGAGIVPMSTRSPPLKPGIVDLGTIEVTRGCVVRGRLVDEAGQPLADQTVSVEKGTRRFDGRIILERNESDLLAVFGQFPPPQRMLLQQLSRFSATTDQDGLFEIREPVAPDTWRVHLFERRRLLQETKLEVLTNESVKWIDLTAERARDVLSGVVVNDIGEPIADARVYFEMINGTHWYLVTGEDGTFRTPRFARDPTDPVKARATISGYTTPDPVSCEWGSSIEIVLTRGGMVDIHVTEAASGIPVLDYGVRIFRVPEHRSVPVNESLLRYFGTHDGGRFRVSGVLPGRSLVMVEPRGSELEPSWFEPVDVTSAEVSQIRIQLHPTATRDLRVVDQAGRPVAGSSVELIRIPGSDTAKVYTAVFRRPGLRGLWVGESALVLAEGSTDREGRFLLRSAPAKGLALRVTGQTHQTVVWNGIELQAGMSELVVEVKPGGEILGRLQPILPLAELDPTLHLLDVDDPSHRFPEGRGGHVPVSADGSFRFANVPEGSWNLVFDAREMPDSVLMTVEGLGPGERRMLSVSIAHLAPARLRGRVYVDGEPVQARVWFELIGNGSGQRLTSYGRGSTADASGTFDLEAPEGRYRLLMESESSPGRWKSEEIVEVFASQETYQEFRFERRRFAAQLVDSDGIPLADRAVEVLWEESTWTASWLRSDGTGHIIVDPAPPGSFHLGLRPPDLVTNDAWAMHRSEHGAKAYEDLIKIGPLQASGAATVELRFPPIRE